MSAPPSAPSWIVNEERRLGALAECGIQSTADEAFDKIALRATQDCAAPISLITLVDGDRQWFKSRVGFRPSQTPLSQSVCKFALDHSGVLVITDLAKDPRTSANILVTGEPLIRFYAGARIRGVDGTPIGSLCVIDTVPRPNGLFPVQAACLESLAFECSTLIAEQAKRTSSG